MIAIFFGFSAVSALLLWVGVMLPAMIFSVFGGLACLERGFRWLGMAVSPKSKVLAGLSMVAAMLPAVGILIFYASGHI